MILTIITIAICATVLPFLLLIFYASYKIAQGDPTVIASKNRMDREIRVAEWRLQKKIKRLEEK